MLDRMMTAMETGEPWHMARASYAYSRWHGLTRWDAFVGAWELFWSLVRDGDSGEGES